MKNLLPNTIIVLAIGILLYSSFSLVLYFKSDAFDLLSGIFVPDMKNLFQAKLLGAITGEKYPIEPRKTETASTPSTEISNLTEKPSETILPAETTYSPIQSIPSTTASAQTNNNLIDTFITSGPEDGEIIEGTDYVKFEFKATTILTQNENDIVFETKVLGLDTKWQTYYNNQRTIYLPAGPAQYTFLARAKYKNIVDQSPASITFKVNNSIYYGKIKINSVQFKTSPYSSTISLSYYYSYNGEKVDITGWLLESRNGSFTIPQGVEKYESLSYFEKDIFIKSGDRIYFSESPSPLGSIKAFKLNKCFGYITNYQNFTIYFYKNCPIPEEQDVLYLSSACQQYVLNLNRCEIPRYWENFTIAVDSECVSFINEYFNYTPCLKRYSQDSDFYENEWHIYMNRTILARGIGQVVLRDRNGYLVDKYIYEYPRY